MRYTIFMVPWMLWCFWKSSIPPLEACKSVRYNSTVEVYHIFLEDSDGEWNICRLRIITVLIIEAALLPDRRLQPLVLFFFFTFSVLHFCRAMLHACFLLTRLHQCRFLSTEPVSTNERRPGKPRGNALLMLTFAQTIGHVEAVWHSGQW